MPSFALSRGALSSAGLLQVAAGCDRNSCRVYSRYAAVVLVAVVVVIVVVVVVGGGGGGGRMVTSPGEGLHPGDSNPRS